MSGYDADPEELLNRAVRDINAARELQGENYPAKLHLAAAKNKIHAAMEKP